MGNGLRVAVRALQEGATSERAQAEYERLLDAPDVTTGAVWSLAATFVKLAGSGAVTEDERDALLQVAERLPAPAESEA